MFRLGPSLAASMPQPPIPSSVEASPRDDVEMAKLLEKKRLQIDEEIEQFKLGKDKEFRNFERELRQRIGSEKWRTDGSGPSRSPTPARSSLLGLLTGARQTSSTKRSTEIGIEDGSIRDTAITVERSNGDDFKPQPLGPSHAHAYQMNISKTAKGPGVPMTSIRDTESPLQRKPANAPSLTGRQTSASLQPTSYSNDDLSSSEELSPTSTTTASTSPEFAPPSPSELSSRSIASSSHTEKRDSADFSTSNYLHLLESKHSSLPRDSIDDLHTDSGRSSDHFRPTNQASTSLPSAFRRRSSSFSRRPKHVLFKLADTAIVEPSSSYEERPSMSSPRNDPSPMAERLQQDVDAGWSMPDRTKSPTLSLKHKSTRHERQDEKKSDEDEMFLLDEDVGQENVKTSPSGEGNAANTSSNPHGDKEEDLAVGSPAAGSLPIDIIRRR